VDRLVGDGGIPVRTARPAPTASREDGSASADRSRTYGVIGCGFGQEPTEAASDHADFAAAATDTGCGHLGIPL